MGTIPGQIPLFASPASLAVPEVITQALKEGAALLVSISGGKDSEALLKVVVPWFRQQRYTGDLVAVYADLGRAEWPQTRAFVEQLCREQHIELIVTRRLKGDLLARIDERLDQLKGTGKPYWPSKGQRYCTSDLKREPIDKG